MVAERGRLRGLRLLRRFASLAMVELGGRAPAGSFTPGPAAGSFRRSPAALSRRPVIRLRGVGRDAMR